MSRIDVAYIRYSSESQRDSTSVNIQTDACERSAGSALKHYIDEARTGRAMAGREQFHRLVADAAAGSVSRVFVYRFDRLGRNESDTFSTVEELESYGVDVISATEGRDAITRGIHLVMAAHYSRELSAKTRAGMLQRHQEGAFTGGRAPYGYKVEDRNGQKVLAVDGKEAAVVRDIFFWYTDTQDPQGIKHIAKRLIELAIPTRSETLRRVGVERVNRKAGLVRTPATWGKGSIRAILLNPVYVGQIIFNKTTFKLDRKSGKRRPVRNDKSLVRSHEDSSLRIIEQKVFETAVAKLAGRKVSTAGTARSSKLIRPFTGRIFCGECGGGFYAEKSQNAKGTYIYYRCGCRRRGSVCPNVVTLREDHLIQMLQVACGRVFDDMEEIVGETLVRAKELASVGEIDTARLLTEIRSVKAEIERRTNLLFTPGINAAVIGEVNRQVGELTVRRDQLQASLDGLSAQASKGVERIAEEVRSGLMQARMSWETALSPVAVNAFVGEHVGPTVVMADGRLLEAQNRTGEALVGASPVWGNGGGGI